MIFNKKISKLNLVLLVTLLLSSVFSYAVSQKKFETGEDMIYRVNDEGKLGPYDIDTSSENFWAIDPVKLTLNSVFLRHLNEYEDGYIAVYATIQPDDDPLNLIKTVYFQELELTGGATLNLTDRILYGPELYKGKPMRLRITILQLDPEKYSREINTFRKLNQVPTDQKNHYKQLMETCASICEDVIHRDKTAIEFLHDLTFHPVVPTGIHGRKENEIRNLALYPDTYVIMKKEKEYRRDSLLKRLTVNLFIDIFGRRADGGDVKPESYALLPLRETEMGYIAGKVDDPENPNYECRQNSYVVLTLSKGDDYFLTDINKEVEKIGVRYMEMLADLDYDHLRNTAIERVSDFLQINENVMEALERARRFFEPRNRINALIEGLTSEDIIPRLSSSEKMISNGTNKDLIRYLEKTTHLHFRTANDWIRRHDQITFNIEEKRWKDNSSARKTDFVQSILNGDDQQLIFQINEIIEEDLPEEK